ncbi:hypothetical protein [Pseudoduganella armeniaca]|uniref:vWA-MoxR associated protein middle region 4 domain-containing protein n=1 Tax=Pseudoduganella armeniaca TaxID=2072590 RepID=A0A2R4CBE8_9BURK|nr:hypothetical protein [Pseudoduganella armeniaca]AVR96915.1 hypothetical protein C9I28_15510 [Pseudoduganella armeniaca]
MRTDCLTAIVVGIGQYDWDELRRLPKAVSDALRFVDWLIDRKVDHEQIQLFLSPQNWSDPIVRDWLEKTAWRGHRRSATHTELKAFFDLALPEVASENVLLFWGGHGFVDAHNRQWLFTADACAKAPYCLPVEDIVHSLARKLAVRKETVCIVDACAELYQVTDDRPLHAPVPLARNADSVAHVHHVGAYAAAPGFSSSGSFAERVLERIAKLDRGAEPDFAAILSEIVKQAASNGGERPRIELIAGQERKVVPASKLPLPGAVAAVDQVALGNSTLYRLYVQSLPQAADAQDASVSPAAALRHLSELHPRKPGAPSPLAEFMVRLAAECANTKVDDWINQNVTPQARTQLEQVLAKEGAADQEVYARLFIEILPEQRMVRWFLQAPDPTRFSPVHEFVDDGAGAQAWLPTLLTRIVDQVATMPILGNARIAIGLLLHHRLLAAGLEATPVVVRGGLRDRHIPLFHRYPVLLHWQGRATPRVLGATPEVEEWEKLLKLLELQLAGTGAAAIKWLDAVAQSNDTARLAAMAAGHLRDERSDVVCIGLPFPPAACRFT